MKSLKPNTLSQPFIIYFRCVMERAYSFAWIVKIMKMRFTTTIPQGEDRNLSNKIATAKASTNNPVLAGTGLALFLFTINFRWVIQPFHIFVWGDSCLTIGLVNLLSGFRRTSIYQPSFQIA